MLRAVSAGLRELGKATDPAEVYKIGQTLEGIEQLMRATGLFQPEQVREANEGKFRARGVSAPSFSDRRPCHRVGIET